MRCWSLLLNDTPQLLRFLLESPSFGLTWGNGRPLPLQGREGRNTICPLLLRQNTQLQRALPHYLYIQRRTLGEQKSPSGCPLVGPKVSPSLSWWLSWERSLVPICLLSWVPLLILKQQGKVTFNNLWHLSFCPSSITWRPQTRWRAKNVGQTSEKSTFLDISSVLFLCQVLVTTDPLSTCELHECPIPTALAWNPAHGRYGINTCW